MSKMHTAGFPHAPIGKTDEWFTPQPIIDALGGANSFTLDPCTAPDAPNKTAKTWMTNTEEGVDGLLERWFGRVWLNPSYNRYAIGYWMKKMAEHNHGTALVSARTDTGWFQDWVFAHADAVFFFHGRISFLDRQGVPGKHNSGGPSVLVAYGEHDAQMLQACGLAGRFVEL